MTLRTGSCSFNTHRNSSATPTFAYMLVIVLMYSQWLEYLGLMSLLSPSQFDDHPTTWLLEVDEPSLPSQVDLNNEVKTIVWRGPLVYTTTCSAIRKWYGQADMTHPRLPQREALVNIGIDQCFHLKWSECVSLSNTGGNTSVSISRWINGIKLPKQGAFYCSIINKQCLC